MKKLSLLVLFLVLSISMVSAYQLTCYVKDQIMPSGRACTSTICQLCLGNDGWSTLPQYCAGQSECVYAPTGSGGNTGGGNTGSAVQTVPPGWNYTQVLQRIEYLESKTIELKNGQQSNQNLLTSLQALITGIQNTINSILTRLAAIEGGSVSLVGCNYNNPACSNGLICQNNQCVNPQQQGCQYNNPACGAGQICVENQCVIDKQVIFRTNIQDERYKINSGEIAIDTNGDGNLECFKYSSYASSYSNRFPQVVTKTMEEFEVQRYNGGGLIIRDSQRNPIYAQGTCTIPLANYPMAGYETREVYK